MYYVGNLKDLENPVIEIFYSRKKPISLTHGHIYNYTYGGYKTKSKAFEIARYQFSIGKIRFFDGRKKSDQTKRAISLITSGLR